MHMLTLTLITEMLEWNKKIELKKIKNIWRNCGYTFEIVCLGYKWKINVRKNNFVVLEKA